LGGGGDERLACGGCGAMDLPVADEAIAMVEQVGSRCAGKIGRGRGRYPAAGESGNRDLGGGEFEFDHDVLDAASAAVRVSAVEREIHPAEMPGIAPARDRARNAAGGLLPVDLLERFHRPAGRLEG